MWLTIWHAWIRRWHAESGCVVDGGSRLRLLSAAGFGSSRARRARTKNRDAAARQRPEPIPVIDAARSGCGPHQPCAGELRSSSARIWPADRRCIHGVAPDVLGTIFGGVQNAASGPVLWLTEFVDPLIAEWNHLVRPP